MTTTTAALERIVRSALEEDAPWGDLTAEAFVPADATASAVLRAREAGVFAGGEAFRAAFRLTSEDVRVVGLAPDGTRFAAGAVLARVDGPARAVLTAERVALNLAQRLSGVATLTAQYVAAVIGSGVRIADTRKTTPGLRTLERDAVRAGGGHNHRFSLSDAVMAKDNHLAVLATRGVSVGDAIRSARERLPHTTRIEVEVDRLDQIEEIVAAGVDVIMLDNFSLEDLREGVAQVGGRSVVEASGGVNLRTVAEIAATGVDVVSVGALTHSARALDLGLDAVVEDGGA